MSWTSLFKKSRLRRDPRIRWFGKLPTYPDYYSSPADENWVVEFNDFVLKGFELYQRKVEDHGTMPRLPVSGCCLRLPKSGMTAFAALLDFGGDMRGRPFPMCFYVAIPTSTWPGPTSEHMGAASRVIRDLVALRREVAYFLNQPARFETVFGEREIDLADVDAETRDGSWMAAAQSLTLTDWYAGIGSGGSALEQAEWLQRVRSFGASLAEQEGKAFEPTLRFPLAMRLTLDAQIAGWICWLEARMDLRRRFLSLIVSGDFDGLAGTMTVVTRETVPEDFLLFTPSADTLPYVDDICVRPQQDNGEGTAGHVAPEPAQAGVESWIDFVQGP